MAKQTLANFMAGAGVSSVHLHYVPKVSAEIGPGRIVTTCEPGSPSVYELLEAFLLVSGQQQFCRGREQALGLAHQKEDECP